MTTPATETAAPARPAEPPPEALAAAGPGSGGDPSGPAWVQGWAASWLAPPLALALALLLLVVNELGFRSVREVTEARDAAVVSRITIGRLRGAITAAESAQRGLLLTGQDSYTQSFQAAERNIQAALDAMVHAARARPAEREALELVMEGGRRKLSEMQQTMVLLSRGERDRAMELVLSGIGRDQMAEINQRVDALVAAQMAELERKAERRDRVLLYTRYSLMALVLACLAAVLTVMAYARRREAERLQHLRALQAERDKLERAVQQRTETLTELARHLQTVREDERSHLARELHDEMGGLLTAAKLDLARLRGRLPGMAPEVAERLEHLRATLDQGIVLKRRIIEDLRPSSLDNLGLQAALDILCREWSERSGVPIHSAVADLPLDAERSLVVYRLVQEALTNVAKYAQARNVMVRLAEVQGAAEVEVSDDGVGFNPQQRVRPQADGQARGHGHGHGHGLVGMQFRVQSCGGTLRLQTAPGQGTRITARLPLPTSIS